MRVRKMTVCQAAGAALLLCAGLCAQETLSTLRGTATDASGSLVPNVSVSVQEVAVPASAAVIETEQGKLAAEFRGERYKDIPIPGNSYGATTTVLAVLPTVQTVAGSQGSPRLAGHGGNQVDMGTDGIKEETL